MVHDLNNPLGPEAFENFNSYCYLRPHCGLDFEDITTGGTRLEAPLKREDIFGNCARFWNVELGLL